MNKTTIGEENDKRGLDLCSRHSCFLQTGRTGTACCDAWFVDHTERPRVHLVADRGQLSNPDRVVM
jgi:hypothetical protein